MGTQLLRRRRRCRHCHRSRAFGCCSFVVVVVFSFSVPTIEMNACWRQLFARFGSHCVLLSIRQNQRAIKIKYFIIIFITMPLSCAEYICAFNSRSAAQFYHFNVLQKQRTSASKQTLTRTHTQQMKKKTNWSIHTLDYLTQYIIKSSSETRKYTIFSVQQQRKKKSDTLRFKMVKCFNYFHEAKQKKQTIHSKWWWQKPIFV